jgi:hypothetical protein
MENSNLLWSIIAMVFYVVLTVSTTASCTSLGAKMSNSAFTDIIFVVVHSTRGELIRFMKICPFL